MALLRLLEKEEKIESIFNPGRCKGVSERLCEDDLDTGYIGPAGIRLNLLC